MNLDITHLLLHLCPHTLWGNPDTHTLEVFSVVHKHVSCHTTRILEVKDIGARLNFWGVLVNPNLGHKYMEI